MLTQLGTALLLVGAVAGLGLAATARLSRLLTIPRSTQGALVPLTGLSSVGLLTLLVGHVGLLGPWLPYALAGAAAIAVWLDRRAALGVARAVAEAAWVQTRQFPLLVSATFVALLLAAVAATAPPTRTDELEYHWPAAVAWAQAGGWNDSPYRHVDGFPFIEVIYTAAATQGSYVAAHLLHLTTLAAFGLAAAGIARALGVQGSAAVATAAMAMPVVWDGAYAAYNDTAVGAFGAAAVAVILGGRASKPALWTAAGLLAVGISAKPSAVAAVGVAGLSLLLMMLMGLSGRPRTVRELLAAWVVLGIPAALTLAFWSTRQWLYTGHWVDPVASAPPDAIAQTMLPTPLEQALSPLLPFVSGIVGAVEPWGGRTSLAVQILLIPALLYVIWSRGDVLRRFMLAAIPAWAHWVVLGLAIVRTRFHIISWGLLVVSVRVALEDATRRWPRGRRWLEALWASAVLLGLVDVSFEMIRLIQDHVF